MTITVPPLSSDPDYRAAYLLNQKLRDDRDSAKVEALRFKAKEHLAVEDSDRDAKIQRLAKGENVESDDEEDNAAKCRRSTKRYWDLDDALEISNRRLRDANLAASKRACEKLKPEHDKIVSRLMAGLSETFNATADLYRLKDDMMAQDIKFIGICGLNPHLILGNPTDKSSPLAYFFREASQLGFSVPKGFKG